MGYATLLLRAFYPQAHIVSVEPAPDNYRMLVENCRGAREIFTHNCAVSNTAGWLRLVDAGSSTVSRQFAVAGRNGTQVRAVTMHQLLEDEGAPPPDVLKIDIEGAEEQLFADADLGWLTSAKCIIIEFHEAHSEALIRSILLHHGFEEQGTWGDKFVFVSSPCPVLTTGASAKASKEPHRKRLVLTQIPIGACGLSVPPCESL